MPQTYTAQGLVALPQLTAITVGTLLQSLITTAQKEPKLPELIAEDLGELVILHKAHHAELIKRQTREGEESPQVKAADKVEDNAFGAFVDWLHAIERLPAERHPESAQATEILQTTFHGGMKWLTIKPIKEWAEAEVRLGILNEKGFRHVVEELGGKPFLDEIDHAHKAYGVALGITEVKEDAETHEVRQTYLAAIEAIRTYVLTVSAHVRKNKPETADLADRLLAPINNWQPEPAKTTQQGGGETKAKDDAAKVEAKKDDAPKAPVGT